MAPLRRRRSGPGSNSDSSQDASQGRDLISDLPDSIIHHIFSFLGHNYTLKVGTLSKRFQQLCMTSPYFYFASQRRLHCPEFISFMRRLMEQRGGSRILKVRFTWHCQNYFHQHSLLHDCLRYFVACNVEELVLDLYLEGLYPLQLLPTSLFISQHMRVLKISGNRLVTLPNVNSQVNSLEVLTLDEVIVFSYVADWISNCCPFLKSLTIKHGSQSGRFRLSIRSSSLEDLTLWGVFERVQVAAEKLQSLHIEFVYSLNEPYSVEINSTNLQSLTWIGTPGKLRFVEGLKMARNAVIDVKPLDYYPVPEYFDASMCQFLCKVLEDLHSVRALHLSNWVIEFLSAYKCIPTGFGDVRHLNLFLRASLTPTIAAFMQELMSLEVLHIRKSFNGGRHVYVNKKVKPLPGREIEKLLRDLMPIQRLKEVEIDLNLKSISVHLVKYILKYARDLETMSVTCPSSDLHLLSSSVQTFEKASSSVAIYLLPESNR